MPETSSVGGSLDPRSDYNQRKKERAVDYIGNVELQTPSKIAIFAGDTATLIPRCCFAGRGEAPDARREVVENNIVPMLLDFPTEEKEQGAELSSQRVVGGRTPTVLFSSPRWGATIR